MCYSGLGLSLSLVPGMKKHVHGLLRMVIWRCYSGLALSQSLVLGMRGRVRITINAGSLIQSFVDDHLPNLPDLCACFVAHN